MLTLGIETSVFIGSIALVDDGSIIAQRRLDQSGRRHAQTLVSEIVALLQQANLAARDCQLVAVSVGPGSFTGLRVGVVFAKTFAYATGCPAIAVDTFEAVAVAAPSDLQNIYVIGDAQRSEVFVGHYARDEANLWQPQQAIRIESAKTWCSDRKSSDSVTGPGLTKFQTLLPKDCRVLPDADRDPTAANVGRIGERLFTVGGGDNLWELEPRYLRKSAAEEKLQSQQPR